MNIQQGHWGVFVTKVAQVKVMTPRNWLAFTTVPCLIVEGLTCLMVLKTASDAQSRDGIKSPLPKRQ